MYNHLLSKVIAIVLLLMVLVKPSTAQRKASSSYFQKASFLKQCYHKGFLQKRADSVVFQRKFFEAFPSSYEELNNLYGWNDATHNPASLYNEAIPYIERFFSLKVVERHAKASKIVGIAMHGKWEADGIEYFQSNLRVFTLRAVADVISVLSKFSDKDVRSFWIFYFDIESSDYRKRYYNEIVAILNKNDRKMLNIVAQAYKAASLEQKH